MSNRAKQRKERLDRGIKVRSEDIFILTSWREMLYVLVPRVLPMLLILIFILVATPYWKRVLVSMAMIGILALSWDLLVSTGLVSLGQALFFGGTKKSDFLC